ncbi:MAG: DUF4199 domain-containing protein [Bacteroidota bacterium]
MREKQLSFNIAAIMNKITPLIKGLITGAVMTGINFLLIYTNRANNSGSTYIFYLLYAAGIAWTLIDYFRSANYKASFGSIFGQGFRCFIIVTLITVLFTGIYSSTHPEIAEEAAVNYRKELVKQGNKTPAQIDEEINSVKKNFVTGNVSLAIFGSLITGAIFTAVGAGLLLIRKK